MYPSRCGDAGAERLQHRVGASHELVDDLASFVGRDVDGDALFPLQHLDRADFGEREDVPDRIAVELFDLDDARAEVGEQRGSVGRGVVGAELEHGDPRQRRDALRRGCARTRARTGGRCGNLGRRLLTNRRGVLVETRRRAVELRGGRVHAHEWPGLEHLAEHGIVHGDDALVLDELRVVQELGAVAEQVGPHVGMLVEDLEPLVVGLRLHAGEGRLPERDPDRGILGVRRVVELGLGEHGVEPGDLEEGLPQPFARLRELHPPPVRRQSLPGDGRTTRGSGSAVRCRREARQLERARVLRREQAHDPVPRVVRERFPARGWCRPSGRRRSTSRS